MNKKAGPPVKARIARSSKGFMKKPTRLTKKGKARIRPFTIVLAFFFLLVLILAYFIVTDPHFLDPINEAILGQRPIVTPSREEISRWTRTPTFDQTIDQSIRQRFLPIPPLELPISETGKTNPFIAVTP